MTNTSPPDSVDRLLHTPEIADALESDKFRQLLDNLPFGIAVAELQPSDHITYANARFLELLGIEADIIGKSWDALPACRRIDGDGRTLARCTVEGDDHLGGFVCPAGHQVEAWSSVIQNDSGIGQFRLLALAPLPSREDDIIAQLQEKDVQLRELQHRVKNNLQMITALIRLEARQLPEAGGEAFARLASRIQSLSLLYSALYDASDEGAVDLGAYLSQVASAVMAAQAGEGIRLNIQVDSWPCSVNVAMPTGLVVNELLTNALKHGFPHGNGGTITLQALVDEKGCAVVVADDGVGFPEGLQWPMPGKLSALIVHSLRENAHARLNAESTPGGGVKVTIYFARQDAAPDTDDPEPAV